MKTELKTRDLWYDGDSSYTEGQVLSSIQRGENLASLYVKELTPAIKQFNSLVPQNERLRIKDSVRPLDVSWNIPAEYRTINVVSYVYDKMWASLKKNENGLYDADDYIKRAQRVSRELTLYDGLGLNPILQTTIYIINTLEKKNVVWGIGRGSSVSSYVLYLIGVHDVDSVAYNLEITDFLRTA